MEINAIINRTKNLIIKPEEEWKVIEAEQTKASSVFTNFVLPYLILNFIASILGSSLFAGRILFYNPLSYGIATAFTSFLVYVIVLFVTPVIIKALASSFGTEVDKDKAFKLVAYSFVPSYVIGILVGLLPLLSVLGILGLYSLYILWHGFGALLHTPEDKKVGFYIVSILIIIGEYFILGFILGAILLGLIAGSFYMM